MQKILIMILSCYCSLALAGKIQVIGTGKTSSEPDSVELTLSIQAQCYPTVSEASNAADQKAAELYQKLNVLFPQKDNNNHITTQGGYTQLFYGITPRNGTETACQNTFQKTTQISISTTKVDGFSELFNKVQDIAYQEASMPIQAVQTQITFVTLNQPLPKLSFSKTRQLEISALENALQNAKEKASQLTKNEGATSLKLIEMYEAMQGQAMPMMRSERMMSFANATSASAPVSFENSVIEKQIMATFEY
ncbi:SIMPL domain-containing protein [Candidatus Berkiella cookevillensis]|uniref:SIMPL domain-containing protein n=1 Tax=Candidatus Berkiella cookevillensis TaxID=437022 RepID=A0A0Q9YNT5_9GAMM|nr:SIMPL domain-containing protein [Candidatus Berkiella cookevillensis]MCS5707316.1 SIMPL domain-containing protein [Candidatus Berkiella cookevillensis]